MLGVCLALIDDEEDKKAFERLYLTHREKLFSISYNILNDKQMAEDALSETFIAIAKCFNKIHNLQVREMTAYLVITIKNKSFDIYSSRTKVNTMSFDEPILKETLSTETEFADSDREILRQALAGLNYKQRTALTYKYFLKTRYAFL